MQIRNAERKQAKIKIAIQGPSGSGKTMSSLLLAHGLTKSWDKVALVDTENGSADLYAHLGAYQVLPVKPPYSPERYIQAIEICEQAGIECIILDSISHCWDFLLEYHSSLTGNSFTNWSKITPRQKRFVNAILQSNCHVIATMRTKQDYVLNQRNGKYIPEKVGLKSIQRDGLDYEFTTVFDIDIKHNVKASKDRTGLFSDKPEFILSEAIGDQILEWCNSGITIEDVREQIKQSNTLEELISIYKKYPSRLNHLEHDFTKKKHLIQLNNKVQTNKSIQNGTIHS